MTRFKAVLFDMDGVIADNEPLHAKAFQAVLEAKGHKLADDDYTRYFAGKTDRLGFEDFQSAIKQELDIPTLLDEKAEQYAGIAAHESRIFPGVKDSVEYLANKGLKTALVTGSFKNEAEHVLSQSETRRYFATIVSAEDVTQSKPDPEGYLQAASLLGCEPAMCLVIEDAPSGVRAAISAGMQCLAVTTTHSESELMSAGATYIAFEVSVAELRKIIER